jgi:REP element-mobilizing transposase RayT
VAPGIPYHVTQRGTDRQQVFFGVADRKLYLQLIRENLGESEVRILAYCLMTNHVHFIAVPEREDSLAVLFGRAQGRYSQAFNIRRGRSGHLWQARYHSCPMSPAHLQFGLRYVETNPCRAGLVERPEQYRWSSAAAHLLGEKDRSGVLDMEYWERAGGACDVGRVARSSGKSWSDSGFQKVYVRRGVRSEIRRSSREMERRFQRKWLRRAKEAVELAKSA